ncbi:hypothetical protein BDW02DRAFT_361820 [Decorospora gaudefroyi]|uniref:Uncharacterized protein n=1 Tax=Decorospora gaudefroyi TaxID=184978 RepID=A0A6A5KVH8_9PLEO|nr:hypothetical protein BDW02DRAFT_361820 [Decorospora gaudefroyi]
MRMCSVLDGYEQPPTPQNDSTRLCRHRRSRDTRRSVLPARRTWMKLSCVVRWKLHANVERQQVAREVGFLLCSATLCRVFGIMLARLVDGSRLCNLIRPLPTTLQPVYRGSGARETEDSAGRRSFQSRARSVAALCTAVGRHVDEVPSKLSHAITRAGGSINGRRGGLALHRRNPSSRGRHAVATLAG